MFKLKRYLLVLALILLLPATARLAPAQDLQEGWQVYTDANHARDLVLEDGGALSGGYTWVATLGGVVCYGASEQKFTTLDGLTDNAVHVITEDSAGRWWFGTWGGGVSVLDDGGTPLDKGDDTWIAFTTTDGLAQDSVQAIVEDSQGRFWIATISGGLSVLDNGGTLFDKGDDAWTTFTTADGLAHNQVQTIVEDDLGRLWLGMQSVGVSVLDDNGTPFDKGDDAWITFSTGDGLADDNVLAIVEDSAGRWWFGTRGGGVSVLDGGGTPFDKGDDAWITFTTADGLVVDNVYDIVEDDEGRLWFGSWGVSVLDYGDTLFDKADDAWMTFTYVDGLAVGFALAIATDGAEQWWFAAGDGGVKVLDNAGTLFDTGDDVWTSFIYSDGLPDSNVDAIVQDGEGRWWFGTWGGGASVLDDAGTPLDKGDDIWTTFTYDDGLVSGIVYALAEDDEGYLWFGTAGGVSVLDYAGTPFDKGDDAWITFTTDDGLAHNFVLAMAEDSGGRWWFGTRGGGVSVLDDGGTPWDKGDDVWITFITADGLARDDVYFVAEDGGGRWWFGTQGGGVSVLDNGGTPFDKSDDAWITFTTADGLASNTTFDIARDSAGRWWFGTYWYGVSVLDDGGTPFDKGDDVWTTFSSADGLAQHGVYAIAEGNGGRQWFGTTQGGVSVLDDGGTLLDKSDDAWTNFTAADGLVDNLVSVITMDDERGVWFGTDSGLGVLVDKVAPVSSANSPVYANDAFPVSWSASDGASGLFSTTLWTRYGSAGTWAETGPSWQGEISGTLTYTPTQGEGVYYFATVSQDWMGNVEAVPFSLGDASTIYDVAAPESSAVSPKYARAGDIPVSWTASDATSGVSSTVLWVKYGNKGSWASTALTQAGELGVFYYTPTQGNGVYYFATVATDNAGNSEATPTGSGDDSTVYGRRQGCRNCYYLTEQD